MVERRESKGLIWDIETSPIISYNWGIWEQNAIEVIEDFQVLSVAWQWVGEKKVRVIGQDDFPGYIPGVNNDKEIIGFIWKLLDECDYEVAHNGDQFDIKKVNARFLHHGYSPPSPYRQVDTKKIAKRVAGFTSNRLKDLASELHVHQKGDPGGFATWKGCLAGDKKAWKKLKKYNAQDIPPLMDLYLILRPWDNQKVPLNVLEGRPTACPFCGSEGTLHKNGGYNTKTNSYLVWHCRSCGGNPRSRVPEYRQATEKIAFV